MTQDSCPSRSRNPTERSSALRSAQNDRTTVALSSPGFTVTTRKIAARVSGAATGCGTGAGASFGADAVIGLSSASCTLL